MWLKERIKSPDITKNIFQKHNVKHKEVQNDMLRKKNINAPPQRSTYQLMITHVYIVFVPCICLYICVSTIHTGIDMYAYIHLLGVFLYLHR